LNRNLPGPDHKASLTPTELAIMVKEIRKTQTALGSFEKKPTASEKKIMNIVRKSIVTQTDIEKGTRLTMDLLSIKRPGTGIPPNKIDALIGKKTKQSLKKDRIIQINMLE